MQEKEKHTEFFYSAFLSSEVIDQIVRLKLTEQYMIINEVRKENQNSLKCCNVHSTGKKQKEFRYLEP